MSALPKFTMQELLDAGVHFGHKTMRWNPRMEPYIYGTRNNIHIIDMQQTVPLLHRAITVARDVAQKNGRVLFVSTKRQASDIIAESARRCGQYFVNHRWLGGMLTNWDTVSQSIKTLKDLEAALVDPELTLSKKERLTMQRNITKLELSLGGIKDMGGVPDLLFVIDTNKEHIAIKEAKRLGIPVIAIVDTNSNPEGIDYPIPGNDDATRSIKLYCDLISDAVLSGMQAAISTSGAEAPEKTSGNESKQEQAAKKDKKSGKPANKNAVEEKKKTETVIKKSRSGKKSADEEKAEAALAKLEPGKKAKKGQSSSDDSEGSGKIAAN